jgi:hypothetical protein
MRLGSTATRYQNLRRCLNHRNENIFATRSPAVKVNRWGHGHRSQTGSKPEVTTFRMFQSIPKRIPIMDVYPFAACNHLVKAFFRMLSEPRSSDRVFT